MASLRPEEQWARDLMARALSLPVVQHDDGSRQGMHDLDVVFPSGDRAAVEVTSAADGQLIALRNLLNGGEGRWIDSTLVGGWMVNVLPSARVKRLRAELPPLLRSLEESGSVGFRVSRRPTTWEEDTARDLSMSRLHQSGTDSRAASTAQ
jgi:hypothetical protein